MNSLYDLCEYGYKIKEVLNLKECGITVADICENEDIDLYKSNKLYNKAREIYQTHKYVFNNNSIYELYEYGISIAIIDSIKSKVTIQDICNYSDKELKEKYDIKYSTIKKIRTCGYFNDKIEASDDFDSNEKEEYCNEINKLKNYGITQNNINKIISKNIQLKDLLNMDIDEIMEKINLSKPTAIKLEKELEEYRIKNNIKKPLEKTLIEYLYENSQYSYIDIVQIYNEFNEYDRDEIKDVLKEFSSRGIVKNNNSSYRYKFLNINETIETIKKERLKSIIELRLQGKNLQEIGNQYGITRERVRQIVSGFFGKNIVEEDIYRNIVEEYNFLKNEFVIIFETSGEVYEYLKCEYEFGEKTLEDFFEDYPEYFDEEKNEKLLSMNKEIIYNGCKIKLNYSEMIKVYVNKLKQQKNLKEILEELNTDFENVGLEPINERYLENRLANLENVICGMGKKYKYFDSNNIDKEKKDCLLMMLNKLPDGYYSTLKLFEENKHFFKSINIDDEYEVHNLLRKMFNGKIPNIIFSAMPSFFVGDIEIEQFIFELIKKYEPIDVAEFLNIVEKEYGHKKNHIRNILQKHFYDYIILEKINIRTMEFDEKEIVLIKSKMEKELYNIESFYNILKQFHEGNYLEYMNNSNLDKLRISFCRKLYIK